MAAFLKFFGSDETRADLAYSIRSEIRRAESHKVAGFSQDWQPQFFNQGDIIYMGRMVDDINLNPKKDYIIFGKGIVADIFSLPRDKATQNDIRRISFRRQWPYYLQLSGTIFINGTLRQGIITESIIRQFQHNSFQRTLEWYNNGKRNFSIRTAFSNQSYMQFTEQASEWVEQRFVERINSYGQVEQVFLNNLPKPDNCL